ncbi:MAG: hypothetical protein LLF76_15320 [Planctomycetaceae bacterium]|nr:hypothetical protein [Planctomycetaceae bacterium]
MIRRVFSDGQHRSRDAAIREVAAELGFKRVSRRTREILDTDIRTAVRRGILENEGGQVVLLTRSMGDYDKEFLKDMFLEAIGRNWIDRYEAMQAAARYLGFTRTGPAIQDLLKSVINGLIRQSRLQTNGPELRRL